MADSTLELEVKSMADSAISALEQLESHLDGIISRLERISPMTKAIGNIGRTGSSKGLDDTAKKIDEIDKTAKRASKRTVKVKVNFDSAKYASKALDEVSEKMDETSSKSVDLLGGARGSSAGNVNSGGPTIHNNSGIDRVSADLARRMEGYTPQKIEFEGLKEIYRALKENEKQYFEVKEAAENAFGTADYEGYIQELVEVEQFAEDAKLALRELRKEREAAAMKNSSVPKETPPIDTSSMDEAETRSFNFSEAVSSAMAKIGPYVARAVVVVKALAKAFKKAKEVATSFAKSVLKVASALGKISMIGLRPVKTLKEITGGLTKAHNTAKKPFLFNLGNMVKLMILRSIIRGIIRSISQGIIEGGKNLAQYSSSYNRAISGIMSSLNYLKNAWGAAFAPIVQVVAPYLQQLVNMFANALNFIGQVLAKLTGKGFAVQASKVMTDYADSLDKTGSSAGNANKQAEKLKRTLLGFDQINKLDDNSSGSGSGSGGGGGNGGGGDVSDMFTTTEITDKASNLAEMIKNSWNQSDFFALGKMVGDWISEGLNDIDWEKYKLIGAKVGKSFATFINGILSGGVRDDKEGWKSIGTVIGESIAEAINVAITTFDSFVTNLDFGKVGDFISDALNGAMNKYDWVSAIHASGELGKGLATAINKVITPETLGNVGKTLANSLNTVIESAYQFVTNADWTQYGKAVAKGINDFFNTADFSKLGLTLEGFANGVLKAIDTALQDVKWSDVGKKIAELISPIEILKLALKIVAVAFEFAFDLLGTFTSFIFEKIKSINVGEIAIKISSFIFDYATGGLGGKLLGLITGEEGTEANLKLIISTVFDTANEILYDFFHTINDSQKTLNLFISTTMDSASTWLKNISKKITTTLTIIGLEKLTAAKKTWENIKTKTKHIKTIATVKGQKLLDKVHEKWTAIKDRAKNLVSKFTYKGDKLSRLTSLKQAWSNLKPGQKKFIAKLGGDALKGLKKISSYWSKLGRGMKNLIVNAKAKLPEITWSYKTKKVGPFSVDYPWPKLSWRRYANGGFPEEGPFMMNRGEIAGKFSNGKSVVANNEQITSGIARAVGPAVYEGVYSALMNADGGNGNVTVVIEGDSDKMFRVIQKKANNYTRSTGKPAFAY